MFYTNLFEEVTKRQIFISHAWKYDYHYNTVCEWIEKSGIPHRNYSVPKHDPLDANNKAKLREMLTEQIRHANVVIIIGGMYAAYSEWIDYEIREAVRMGKYIIGIKPWGHERIPLIIQQCANDKVGWNSSSLINAIKKTNG